MAKSGPSPLIMPVFSLVANWVKSCCWKSMWTFGWVLLYSSKILLATVTSPPSHMVQKTSSMGSSDDCPEEFAAEGSDAEGVFAPQPLRMPAERASESNTAISLFFMVILGSSFLCKNFWRDKIEKTKFVKYGLYTRVFKRVFKQRHLRAGCKRSVFCYSQHTTPPSLWVIGGFCSQRRLFYAAARGCEFCK